MNSENSIAGAFDMTLDASYFNANALNYSKICNYVKRDNDAGKIPQLFKSTVHKFRQVKSTNTTTSTSVDAMTNAMAKKIREVIENKRTIKIDGFEISNLGFHYDTLSVNCASFKEEYHEALESLAVKINNCTVLTDIAEQLNFNILFEQLFYKIDNMLEKMKASYYYRTRPEKVFITINSIPVIIKRVVNPNNSSSVRYQINDIKVNHEELSACAARALNYSTSTEYMDFLESVSKCSLNIYRLLDGGVVTNLNISNNNQYYIRLNFEREKSRNYLIFNEARYKIKNLRGFDKELNNISDDGQYEPNIAAFINLFSGDKYVADMDTSNFLEMIKTSKDVYINELKQSDEALEEVKTLTKAIEATYTVRSESKLGLEILSVSGNKYFIADSGDAPNEVWRIDEFGEMSYVCMVDKTPGASGKDKLISRLLALSMDSYVSDEIYTLEQYTNDSD